MNELVIGIVSLIIGVVSLIVGLINLRFIKDIRLRYGSINKAKLLYEKGNYLGALAEFEKKEKDAYALYMCADIKYKINPDHEGAFDFYKKSFIQDSDYEKFEDIIQEYDEEQLDSICRKVKKIGYKALYMMGHIKKHGEGVGKNVDDAKKIFSLWKDLYDDKIKSYNEEDKSILNFWMGEICLDSEPEKAEKYYKDSADRGNPVGMRKYAYLLEKKGEYEVALNYRIKAAQLRDTESIKFLIENRIKASQSGGGDINNKRLLKKLKMNLKKLF